MKFLVFTLLIITAQSQAQNPADRTWTFSTSANRRPQVYINETDGSITGFTVDLVKAVCSLFGGSCEFIQNDYNKCVVAGKSGEFILGDGLKNREFDVCPGTVATADRTEAGAAFTLPFLDTQARFQVIPGNPRGFDPSNVEGKTIVHGDAFYTNKAYLHRIGLNGATVLVANSISEAISTTLNGTADALFSPRTNLPPLETLPREFDCSDGVAHMVLPGSEFVDLWNFYFEMAVATGVYERICNAAPQRHGRRVDCFIDLQFKKPGMQTDTKHNIL